MSNANFVTGDYESDVNFLSDLVHNQASGCYKLCGDLVIDTRIDCYQNFYRSVELDNGFEFDGDHHTIKIIGDGDFSGIFRIKNGTVKNLTVIPYNSVMLTDGAGWINTPIDYANLADDTDINTIYSICVIKNSKVCGGHIGQQGSKYVTARSGCGGISGAFSGFGNLLITGSCSIVNCSTNGCILGNDCGGIVGSNAGSGKGSCTVINCTTSGDINGEHSGGICGGYCNTCHIINTTTSGEIFGNGAGGIAGQFFGTNNLRVVFPVPVQIPLITTIPITGDGQIINCSTSGYIGTYKNYPDGAGGIVGSDSAATSSGPSGKGYCLIMNCTITGEINGSYCGGILAPSRHFTVNDVIVINGCLVTSSNDLSKYIESGRIAGKHTSFGKNTRYKLFSTCYYNDVIGGTPTTSVNYPNYPTINLAERRLYKDADCIDCIEYDGYHAMALVDLDIRHTYKLGINKITFDKHNVHPLCGDQSYIVQRDVTNKMNSYFEFTVKYDPSQKMLIFWIPNTNNNNLTKYNLLYKDGCELKKIGSLVLVNDQTIDSVRACNLWKFTFPQLNNTRRCSYEFVIMAERCDY